MKQNWKAGTMIYPLPAVLVTVGNCPENYNVLTIAWVGTICSDPPMCYVSIRKERHSHAILTQTKEFVINLTNETLARATDWCGVRSGRNFNKFQEMQLTPIQGQKVKAPIIDESPLSIECKVQQIIELGTHDMFIAEVVNVQADEQYIDPVTGKFDMQKAQLITYSHGQYYTLGKQIGKFGWSVEKKKRTKRYAKHLCCKT